MTLEQWVAQVLNWPDLRVQVQSAGTHLHILCEGMACPDPAVVEARFRQGLTQVPRDRLPLDLPLEMSPRLILLYGRRLGQTKPAWTRYVELDNVGSAQAAAVPAIEQPEAIATADVMAAAHDLERFDALPLPPATAAPSVASPVQSAWSGLARRAARHVGETLKQGGIQSRVTVKITPAPTDEAPGADRSTGHSTGHRLWAICQVPAAVDWSAQGPVLARSLRALDLEGFRDGYVLGQALAESEPGWILRVNLTAPRQMLFDWARWGDVQAFSQLLDRTLGDRLARPVSAVLEESTLHVFARLQAAALTTPAESRSVVSTLARAIAPQGIHSLVLYGCPDREEAAPQWVEWMDLPASARSELAESALTLARAGDRAAQVFLLERAINQDLDDWMASGGLRAQLCRRGDLLHVMIDGPTCPDRDSVAALVAALIRDWQVPGLAGVRIYGRAAGSKQPQWQRAEDFTARSSRASQHDAAPDFAGAEAAMAAAGETRATSTSEAAAIERASSDPPAQSLAPRLSGAGASAWSWADGFQGLVAAGRSCLVATGIWAAEPTATPPAHPVRISVWQPEAPPWLPLLGTGAIGLTLVLGIDWVAARPEWALSSAAQARRSASELLNLSSGAAEAAEVAPEPPKFPSFNSPQFDRQLTLYQQFVLREGVPDVLVVGSSRALRGIDPARLRDRLGQKGKPKLKVFNFGINGATAKVVQAIVQGILPPEQLPKLILWADGTRAFNSGRADATYQSMAASPAYRALQQGKFPRPVSLNQTATELPPPEQSASANPNSTPLTSTREVPNLLRRSWLGVAVAAIPTPEDFEAWLQDHTSQLSQTHSRRESLKATLRDRWQGWSLFAALGAGETLRRGVDPALPDLVQGARVHLGKITAASGHGRDGVVDLNGFLPLSVKFDPQTYYQTYPRVPGDFDSDYRSFSLGGEQFEALTALLVQAKTRGVAVVFVNVPLTDDYLDGARSTYEQQFDQFMRSQPLTYLDLSRLWVTRYDRFSDPSHLNRYGAQALTDAVATSKVIPWPQAQP
ncbi:MAG: hypothetical protein EA001_04900 [Oscillatoriales cyanobacterium]|nr:MAG: hypothetical protein EA001_04900 [Oscillatoriales cyanobacterium]